MFYGNKILWHPLGARLEMTDSDMRNADSGGPLRTLYIGDLNPEQEITWGLCRWDMIKIGLWFIWTAFFPSKKRN